MSGHSFTVTFTVEIDGDLTSTVEHAVIIAAALVGEGAISEDVTVVEHEFDGDITHAVSYLDIIAPEVGA